MTASVPQNLLADAVRGDRHAFERLLAAERGYLQQVVAAELNSSWRRKVCDSDIVQNTLQDAERSFPYFRGTSVNQWRRWARAIAVNNVRVARRRYLQTTNGDVCSAEPAAGTQQNVCAASEPPDQVASAEQLQALRADLKTLPSDYSQALRMRYWEQRSFDIIAADLNTTPKVAQTIVFRALKMLLDVRRTRNP